MSIVKPIWGNSPREAFFRRRFTLRAAAERAVVRIYADTGYELFLNERLVAVVDEWNNTRDYDVSTFLKNGENLVAVHGLNHSGHRGLSFELCCDGASVVVSDENWRIADREVWDWTRFAFDDLNWPAAQLLPLQYAGLPQWKGHAGDRPEAVMENFRRIGAELGVRCEDMVLSQQTHTANVRVVTGADRGKGITRERDYTDVDGLITNEPGICLVTSFADCVPLYFVDPVKKAIGLSHSGWRGTVGKIGKRTVEMMGEYFGSDPADILAAVGPSVCMDCYEVSGDVIEKFRQVFDEKLWPELFYEKENGKCQLDLWKANELIFLESGILPEHMAVTNLCTHCNSEILYSHRAAGDKRGNLCAFLALKEG